jgi:agmatinase
MKDFSYPTLEPFNFLGLENQDYKKSKVVVFPIPYSSTTYWKSGTKDGPQAIIEASRHVELYDIEIKKDPSLEGIFTLEPLEPSKNSPKETIERIKGIIDKILEDKKIPIILGGEHSITLGVVESFKEKFSDFSVLQLDAHADLRDEFEGTKCHHACTMKRIKDLGISVIQVGIRSVSEEEVDYIEKNKIFYAPEIPVGEIIDTLKENVYLTLDLDVLDSSIMPSVGTPEPGGLGWYETINLIKEVASKRKIIGADIVELDPIPGLSAPDFLAAKLVYKIISYII